MYIYWKYSFHYITSKIIFEQVFFCMFIINIQKYYILDQRTLAKSKYDEWNPRVSNMNTEGKREENCGIDEGD